MLADIKKELSGLDTTPGKLRSFGLLIGVVLGIWTGFTVWKGHQGWAGSALAGAFFLLSAVFFPSWLRRPYRAWMLLAMVLGWLMTRVILTIAFSVIMTPFGLMLRLAGKDLLDQKIDKGSPTYWKRHEGVADREQYKRQF